MPLKFSCIILLLLSFVMQSLQWCQETYFQTFRAIRLSAVSPSSRYLAIAHGDDVVRFYSAVNYNMLGEVSVGSTVNVMRFSQDGNYLAVGTIDDKIRLVYAYQPFGMRFAFDAQVGNNIIGLDFSTDSTLIIACGGTGVGKLSLFNFTANNGNSNPNSWSANILTLTPASTQPNDCRFSPFNDHIAVDTDNKITIYNKFLVLQTTINSGPEEYGRLFFNPVRDSIFYIDKKFDQLYEVDLMTHGQSRLQRNALPYSVVDVTANGQYIATGGTEQVLYIYNQTLTQLFAIPFTDPIASVSFNHDTLHPKLFVSMDTGNITVLALNCSVKCQMDQFYRGFGCEYCMDFIDKCLTCINATQCDRCLEGYYVDPNQGTCKVCGMLGCISCLTSGYCQGCQEGFYLTSNKCKRCSQGVQGCAICNSSSVCIACIQDYYVDTSTNKCKNCSSLTPKCLKCHNSSACVQCQVGFYLYTLTLTCLPCDTNCLSCQYSPYNCSQCHKGYYVAVPYTCTPCQANCLSCNNSNFCFECIESMWQKADGTCASCVLPCIMCENDTYCYTCAQRYYMSSGTCVNCPANCSICNSTYCSSCLAGYLFVTGGTCKACSMQYPNCQYCSSTLCQSCFNGYYLNTSTQCDHCSNKMFKCSKCSSSTTCLQCFEGFYMTGLTGNSSCKSCAAGCEVCYDGNDCRKCFEGYYIDGNLDCLLCEGNCLKCDTAAVCEVCDEGYYLDTVLRNCRLCSQALSNCLQCWNGTACLDCDLGFYLDPGDQKCKRCSQYCLTCNSSQCLTCVSGYYLDTASLPITCKPCSQPCTQCSSLTTCHSCKSGYYLKTPPNSCISCTFRHCRTCSNLTCYNCLNGYFLDNYLSSYNQCTSCLIALQGCTHCNLPTECLECDYGYYLNPTTKKCLYCPNGCEQCDNAVTCLKCEAGFYMNSTFKCVVCPQGCTMCLAQNNCLACSVGFYLSGTLCKPCNTMMQGCTQCTGPLNCIACLNSFYLDTVTHACKFCRSSLAGCLYCNSSSVCTHCQPGFYLNSFTHKCQLCSISIVGCQVCTGSSLCVQCQIGYWLNAAKTSCIRCQTPLQGCIKCKNSTICEQCKTGYYLNQTLKLCQQCNQINSGCQSCKSLSSASIKCLDCSPGFYLSALTSLCHVCQTIGCEICLQTNPTKCVSCDTGFYMDTLVQQCKQCNEVIQGCNLCTVPSACLTCDTGYYLNLTNNNCHICQNQLIGCSKCLPNPITYLPQCQQCKSSFLLNPLTKKCTSCSQLMQGCSYCLNSTECVSCARSFYKNSTTLRCQSCTEIQGCLFCDDEVKCEYCQKGYFLQGNHTCTRCQSRMVKCLSCLGEGVCLSCDTGYQLSSDGARCEKYVVQQKDNVTQLKLTTQYINQNQLHHTLRVRQGQFSSLANISLQTIHSKCKLYLTDYSPLYSQTSRKLHQFQLEIKQITLPTPSALTFVTLNPTTSSAINTTHSRLLARDQWMDNYKVSIEMQHQLVNVLLPGLYQTYPLVMDYSLDEPEFFNSYLKNSPDGDALYKSYSIFGYVVVAVLVLNFINKTTKLQKGNSNGKYIQKNWCHFTGEMVSHVLSMKTVVFLTKNVTFELYYFSFGFMALDVPWGNELFKQTKLVDLGDYVPQKLARAYDSLNICQTGIIQVGIVILLILLGKTAISNTNPTLHKKYTQLLYCIFSFNLTFNPCLSLQGAILNPITTPSINSLFYLIGITLYLTHLLYILHQLHLSPSNIYKLRIFIKGTLLSLAHYSPIIMVSVVVMVDLVMMGVQYRVVERQVAWVKVWVGQHVLVNVGLLGMVYWYQPHPTIIYLCITLISLVVITQILLNLKLMKYCQRRALLQQQQLKNKKQKHKRKRYNNSLSQKTRKYRQTIRVEQLQGNHDSLQTIIGQQQDETGKNERAWDLDEMWDNGNGRKQKSIDAIMNSEEIKNFEFNQVEDVSIVNLNRTKSNQLNSTLQSLHNHLQFIQQQQQHIPCRLTTVKFLTNTKQVNVLAKNNKNRVHIDDHLQQKHQQNSDEVKQLSQQHKI